MAYTEITDVNVTSNPTGLFNWLNDVTNYWFSNSLLMALWFIIVSGYLYVNKDDFKGAFSVAGYVVSVLAIFGWIMGIVGGLALGVCLGVSMLATAWLLIDQKN